MVVIQCRDGLDFLEIGLTVRVCVMIYVDDIFQLVDDIEELPVLTEFDVARRDSISEWMM